MIVWKYEKQLTLRAEITQIHIHQEYLSLSIPLAYWSHSISLSIFSIKHKKYFYPQLIFPLDVILLLQISDKGLLFDNKEIK